MSLLYGWILNLAFTKYIFNVYIIARTIRVAYAAPIIPNSVIRYIFKTTANTDENKENKKVYVPFSEQEINDVLKSFNGNDFETIRNRLIIELLYCTGMRRNELINVKIKDIDFIQERIKVLGKRKKERYIPLVGPLKKSLNNYIYCRKQLKIIKDSELLFLSKKGAKLYGAIVYRIVKIYFQIVSSKVKKSPHILRHSFATHLLKNGADLNAVKELLGHSSLAATQIYTNNNISELKKYIRTHIPGNQK